MNCHKKTLLLLTSIFVLFMFTSIAGFGQASASAGNLSSGPQIWLQQNQPLPVQHIAVELSNGHGMAAVDQSALAGLGQAQPVSMASGDLDQDGVDDLVVGYSGGNAGFISIQRGNIDAFAPQSDSSFRAIGRGEFPAPFHLEAKTFSVPVRPDFIALGNFIGGGNKDLAVAARGGNQLYIFPGDGKGNFGTPQTMNLAGGVTALAEGELGGSHTPTLIVGGSRSLTVYVSTPQGLKASGSYSTGGAVSNVQFGDFGDAGPDVAFLSNGKVQILRSSTMGITTVSLPVSVRAFALGSFIYDRNGGAQIAVVASDGSVQIAVRSAFDPRPYSSAELTLIRQAAPRGRSNPLLAGKSFPNGWKIVESFPGVASLGAGQTPVFFRTRISNHGADDVMLLNPFAGQLVVISHPNLSAGASAFLAGQVSLRPYSGTPLAAQAMRINVDGRPGVMALHQGEVAPSMIMPIPDPTFFVNTFNDPTPTSPIANACNNTSFADTSSSCSLREAVLKANGDTIMLQAGTYTLTRPRVDGDNSGQNGALYVNNTATIVGTVDGSGNPASIIQAGTTSSNGVDLVMAVNEDITSFTDATASLSNLVIQFGHNNGSFGVGDGFAGGIEFDTGGAATATLTLTNVTVTNNSTTDGDGGGLAIFNTNDGSGAATITASIIQNNTPQESSTGGSGLGGGIYVGQPGSVILSNTQVINNNATQANTPMGQGGGLYLTGGFGTPQTSAVHSGSISGNNAAGEGGGIYSTQGITIDAGTVINNNTSGVAGGGIWYNATSPFTATLSKITITGNSVTGVSPDGVGGGVRVESASNAFTMSFSRLAGNSASTAGSNLSEDSGTVTAANNWWGTNAPAGTIDSIGGSSTFDPFIVLTHTASPNKIHINQSSTLTGDMSKDNHGNGAALAGNLDVLNGLPITFHNAVLGTIAEAQPEVLNASAQATATFNAGGTGGNGSADATVDQQTVTASITILQPPSITKSLSPTTVTPNTASTITFSITNGNTVTIDSSFTDSLPAGLVVATAPNVVNACGGTVTATAGTGSISFANPSLAVGTCSIQVNVQSAVDNIYNNSVTINSADAGTGNTSSATLTVINPPAIAKAFGAATIPLNGTTSLTFTLNSTNTNLTLNGVAFTDNLPAGLIVATPGNLTNTCGGTATAANGSSSVALSGASLAPGASCTVSVNVQGTTAGVKSNSVSVTSTNGGNGNTANASITVIAPPTLAKVFGAASIPLNGTTSLSFSINNPNSSNTLTGIGFTDTLPAGLVISTPNGLTGSCGAGTITAMQNTGVISLSGATLAAGASCSFSVNVTGIAAGTQNNTSGNVTSNEGGTGGSASASIIVVAPPTTAKAFTPAGIQPNGTSTMTITITNPAGNTVALTNLSFTDNFPVNVVVATPNGLTNTCGGAVTATAGSATVSLTGGTVAANSSCTVSVSVTSAATGIYLNDTGPVSSDNGGTGGDATATLSVAFAPTISKVFVPDSINQNQTTLLSFTINNPNSFSNPPSSDVTLTGIAFTDNLPAGLVIANPNNLSNTCDGTVTANPGSSTLTLTGGDLGPAVGLSRIKPQHPLLSLQQLPSSQPLQPLRPKATGSASQSPLPKSTVIVRGGPVQSQQPSSSGSCFISVEVQATVSVPVNTSVMLNNTTGPISANESGTGATSNTATLTVSGVPPVQPPTIAKAFGGSTVPLNGTTTLTLTFGNPNSSTTLNNVSVDDPLPSGLIASPNGITGSCFADGGFVVVNGSGTDIQAVGTSLSPNTSCSFTINVTGTTSGLKNNTTGNVGADYNAGSETAHTTGGTASASILVVLPPVIAKAFNPSSIALSQTTSLGFTITNPAANPIALTGVGFTDLLQAGLTVANGSSAVCGGTLTTSGGNTITLSGATIAVNSSCNFSVTVTPTAFGNYTNTTSNVTSNEGGTGNAATAALTVFPVVISPGSVNFGDVDSDQSRSTTVTISNNGNAAVSLSISLTPGSGTSANNFSFSTGCSSSLAAHHSCTVTVTFTAPHVTSVSQLGVSTATLNVVSAGFTQHVPLSANVIDPEPQFTPGSLSFGHVTVNHSSILTTTLKNVGLSALNITGFTITGNQPGDFSQTNNCPASLAPGNSCTINVTFTPKATGNRDAKLNLIANDEAEFVPISGIGQ